MGKCAWTILVLVVLCHWIMDIFIKCRNSRIAEIVWMVWKDSTNESLICSCLAESNSHVVNCVVCSQLCSVFYSQLCWF